MTTDTRTPAEIAYDSTRLSPVAADEGHSPLYYELKDWIDQHITAEDERTTIERAINAEHQDGMTPDPNIDEIIRILEAAEARAERRGRARR